MKSLVFGSAFEVPNGDPIADSAGVRTYHIGTRTFIGHDTHDMEYACGSDCARELVESLPDHWTQALNQPYYVCVTRAERKDDGMLYVPTIDVVDFDRGDDPYVRCSNCLTELFRDDEAYEAMYGTTIDEVLARNAQTADDNQGTLL